MQYFLQSLAQAPQFYFIIQLFDWSSSQLVVSIDYFSVLIIQTYHHFKAHFLVLTITCFTLTVAFLNSIKYCSLQVFEFETRTLS
jgi:hypothetical protein